MSEFVEELVSRYPNLYRGVNDYSTGFCGIYVPTGWQKIVEKASSDMESYIMEQTDNDRKSIYVVQIKEKFGGLRIYMSVYSDAIDHIITVATEKAYKTCDKCGEPGEHSQTSGWYSVTCKACDTETLITEGTAERSATSPEN